MPKSILRKPKASAKPKQSQNGDFIVRSVSIPKSMFDQVVSILELDPEGANLSRYVRALIRKDLESPQRELLRQT